MCSKASSWTRKARPAPATSSGGPRGNRHVARAPEGALVLSFFLKPNVFIDQFAGQKLE